MSTNEFNDLKAKVHDRLVEILDLSLIDSLEEQTLRQEIRRLTANILSEDGMRVPLNADEKERFFREIQDEILGLGPIEPFLQDPSISDVLVNYYRKVYVERLGKLELTDARFKDDAHLRNIIDKIVSAVGRRIDESTPMVDAASPTARASTPSSRPWPSTAPRFRSAVFPLTPWTRGPHRAEKHHPGRSS